MAPARTLVIPMYREASRIGSTIAAIATSPLNDPGTEVLLVDDGSDDGTPAIAKGLAAELGLTVTIVELGVNQGKGAAVRAGMQAAAGAVRAFADADLATDTADIEACFRRVEAGPDEVVVATRSHPDSTITVAAPRHRVLIGRTYNGLLRRLGLTDSLDTQCGLKGFTAAAAGTVFPPLRTTGFAFDIEVLARARQAGLTIGEMPIAWGHVEGSRVGLRSGLRSFVDAVRIRRDLGPARPGHRPPGDGPATAMAAGKYEVMAATERRHWWFRAKRRLVLQEAERAGADRGGLAVDVGCGTGAVLEALAGRYARTVGTDLSLLAADRASRLVGPASGPVLARAEALPFRDASAALLTSLDVLEHLDDDVAALAELRRVVRDDGVLVLAVPAYEWAWSDHDVVLGHRRRYTVPRLRRVAEDAGLDCVRVTYFHSWLAPLAFLIRRTPLRHLVGDDQEEASDVGPAANRVLEALTAVERRIIRRAPMPFGLSVLLVARPRPGPGATAAPATSAGPG
ncbi:MAG: glycosyltransferase [Acidimicrobiales bacterium]|nr:glycosyltransferase [Acidimicrobiales bacterium]MCB9373718.1 glycosyltransferase [Microthrixaceae bacterium]